MNSILLSISILSNGKSKYLKKTISSLDSLRNNVPSELVMVDTGCDKDSREYLESIADKVIDFAWCDDFAAARNAGLSECSGEWFMYMDDDEWFEETAEIESFFRTGEFKEYNSLQYMQRNYSGHDGLVWADENVIRCCKLNPETRFMYPIHEQLHPIFRKLKITNLYVHHYGYILDDATARKAKSERNISLLIPFVKANPDIISHRRQLMLEYWDNKDFNKAYEQSLEIINRYKYRPDDISNHIYIAYGVSVMSCLYLEQYDYAYNNSKIALSCDYISDYAKALIYSGLIEICTRKNNYSEAIEITDKYLELKALFKNNPMRRQIQTGPVLDMAYNPIHYAYTLGWSFYASLNATDINLAENLMANETIDWWIENIGNWYSNVEENTQNDWKDKLEHLAHNLANANSIVKKFFDILTSSNGDKCNERRELLELSYQLKDKIRFLINAGQSEAALATIDQLLTFLPDDTELIELKKSL